MGLTNRCPDYWSLDLAWRKAEKKADGKAEEALKELQEHARTCHQCRLWWMEMMERLKNE